MRLALQEELSLFGRTYKIDRAFYLSLLAVPVGLFVGLASVGFIYLIRLVQQVFFGAGEQGLTAALTSLHPLLLVLLTTVGGLAVGLASLWLLPQARPRSVADVIEVSALRGGYMSLNLGLKASLLSVLSIGVGGSVGREGPMVYLGASIGAWAERRLRMGRQIRRTLLGCGVAAGVAASFNAPLAGTIFALEVVIGSYALGIFAPTVVAAVTGTLVSRLLLGSDPAFSIPNLDITSSFEFPAFALLGIVSGVWVVLFGRSFFKLKAWRDGLRVPLWVVCGLAGTLLGLLALVAPGVLGVGYELTSEALSGDLMWTALLLLLAVKTIATLISIAAGYSGGVFSPALAMGAILGGLFASVAIALSPVEASQPAVYAVIGMGATAAAMIGSPFSTILMTFELTGNYPVTLGVMIAAVVASLVTRQFFATSFFTASLAQRGVNLRDGADQAQAQEETVAGLIKEDCPALQQDAPMQDVKQRLLTSHDGQLMVLVGERLVGLIDFRSLAQMQENQTARDHYHDTLHLYRSSSLQDAMRTFESTGASQLPVLQSPDSMKFLGVVHDHDVSLAYHRAVLRGRGLDD